MLVIRPAQMQALEAAARRRFESTMAAHLAEFAPAVFRSVGETEMLEFVRFGVERAGRHGFSLRGPVRLYLEMMVVFGSFFDTDPQYPWASAISGEFDADKQMQRAQLLFEEARDFETQVLDVEEISMLDALDDARARVGASMPREGEDFVAVLLEEIILLSPQRIDFSGVEGLRALIREAVALSDDFGFPTVRGGALMMALMLTFGHGCVADPLFPWIRKILQDPNIADPVDRAVRLEIRAQEWLDDALGGFEDSDPA